MLVSFSTSYQGQRDTLQRVADALGGLPVRAIVTTGPAIDPGEVRVASNTEVAQFVPHATVLPEAALTVTHAGLGTVMSALAHGVPMVCVPMGRDQFFNAAMVERLGAGVSVDAAAPREAIAAAVEAVLRDAGHRAAAERFARVIAGHGGAADAVTSLELLHGQGQAEKEVFR